MPAEQSHTSVGGTACLCDSKAYQKDKRVFGFVKDWVSFIYDKATDGPDPCAKWVSG